MDSKEEYLSLRLEQERERVRVRESWAAQVAEALITQARETKCRDMRLGLLIGAYRLAMKFGHAGISGRAFNLMTSFNESPQPIKDDNGQEKDGAESTVLPT